MDEVWDEGSTSRVSRTTNNHQHLVGKKYLQHFDFGHLVCRVASKTISVVCYLIIS